MMRGDAAAEGAVREDFDAGPRGEIGLRPEWETVPAASTPRTEMYRMRSRDVRRSTELRPMWEGGRRMWVGERGVVVKGLKRRVVRRPGWGIVRVREGWVEKGEVFGIGVARMLWRWVFRLGAVEAEDQ